MARAGPRDCCSGCGARITWVRTRSGKAMPCDPGVVSEWVTDAPTATTVRVTLVDPDGATHTGYRASVLTPESRNIEGYVSHFSTCPQAATFRRAATR